MTSSRFMPPIGSTPSKPASFMARNFSSTLPFTPMVEYMMALRRLRLGTADRAFGRNAVVAAMPAVTFKKERRFMVCYLLSFQNPFPTFAILGPLDERVCGRRVGGAHRLVITFQFFSSAIGHVAEMVRLGGPAGILEV